MSIGQGIALLIVPLYALDLGGSPRISGRHFRLPRAWQYDR